MAIATMRDLLEAGIHFGHQTRRWHPKMKPYIFGQRNGIYIIDLKFTMRQLYSAYGLVRETVSKGGTVLFVGTKKQAQEPVQREAERCGQYYVTNRWLGGMLTNFQTVRQSIGELNKLQEMETNGKIELYSKKEAIMFRKRRAKLEKNLTGIQNMPGQPSIMFVVDAKREAIAIHEGQRLHIPVIGITDTNCDPNIVDLPIPGNDDAIRAIGLFCKVIADAVIEGKMIRQKKDAEKAKADEVSEEVIEAAATEEVVVEEAPAEVATETPAKAEAEVAPAAEVAE